MLTELVFSPDGKVLATSGPIGIIHLWDVVTGKHRVVTEGHKGPIDDVTWSPDGKLIATGGSDGTVRLWAAQTGEPRGRLRNDLFDVNHILFAPVGARGQGSADLLAAVSGKVVNLWDPARGRLLRSITTEDKVNCLAFTNDGKNLYCAGSSLSKWDPSSGTRLRTVQPGAPVSGIAPGADGQALALLAGESNQLFFLEAEQLRKEDLPAERRGQPPICSRC
jgi:WD40 repeat protein